MLNDGKELSDASISDVLRSIRRAVEGSPEMAHDATIASSDHKEPLVSSDQDVLELNHPLDEEEHSAPWKTSSEADMSIKSRMQHLFHQDDGVLVQKETPFHTLISSETVAHVNASLSALKHAPDKSTPASTSPSDHDVDLSRALSASVKDILRPLLKDWLDKNLPSIVHNLVSQEIQRLRHD